MEEHINRKLKLLENRKQLEFEIGKDEVYQNYQKHKINLKLQNFQKKKSWKISKPNIKKSKQEIINIKVKDIGALNPIVKNKTLQTPSNLLESCQLLTYSTKTITKVRKPSKLVSKTASIHQY